VTTKTRGLGLAEARALIADCGFGGPTQLSAAPTVGVELESFTEPAFRPGDLPAPAMPGGSRLTFEPGGQVELSAPPAATVGAACGSVAADLAALDEAFSPVGVRLLQQGTSPRPRPRLVDGPRYRAMEAYFDASWPSGRVMMCSTASVQVNLGLGPDPDRWRAANLLGPVLAAAFANSPVPGRCATSRLATWLALDPSRTAAVPAAVADPGQAWADYALAARVMLIRVAEDRFVPLLEPVTAQDWVTRGHPLGWPTGDDLVYHLTTLFPPVRPRGWLELRMIDALPDPWWRVPVAVAAALVDDAEAISAAEGAAGRWWPAARAGLADPRLAAAARLAAARALAGLDRVGADSLTAILVEQWAAAVKKGTDLPWT
jgi:glutamate--cysteine ligase